MKTNRLAIILAISVLAMTGCSSKKKNDTSVSESSQPTESETSVPDLPFTIDPNGAPSLKKLPTLNEEGILEVKGKRGNQSATDDFALKPLSNSTYYTSVNSVPDCEHGSGKKYTAKDSYVPLLQSKYDSLSDIAASNYYEDYILGNLTNIFAGDGNESALGHDYNKVPVMVAHATTSAKGAIKFVCERDHSHEIVFETPVLSETDYLTAMEPATCVKKPGTRYTIKEDNVKAFLNDNPALYADEMEKNILLVTIIGATVEVVENTSGDVDDENHVGTPTFKTYSYDPILDWNITSKKAEIEYVDSNWSVLCGECNAVIGYTEDVSVKDVTYVIPSGAGYADAHYDTVFDGEHYDVVCVGGQITKCYVDLHVGSDVTITPNSDFSAHNEVSIFGNFGNNGLIIPLGKISDGVKTASELDVSKIKVYFNGNEVDYPVVTSKPSETLMVYKRGSGLYINMGTVDDEEFLGGIDIAFDFN